MTLHILTALMEKVPRDLPIFARYVLSVIDTVLRSQDITMVEDSIETFETFCTHQDLASLAAEQDLSTQFQSVLRTYASFTDTKSASSQARVASSSHMAIRWRNAGIRAMRGVVGSDEAQAADGGDCLKIVLPVILETMYSGEEDLLVLLQLKAQEPEEGDGDGEGQGQEEAVAQRRASVASIANADATTAEADPAIASETAADADRKAEMDVRLLALQCLEQIVVSGSSRGQIRLSAMAILRFIMGKAPVSNTSEEKQGQADGATWATSLMELVTKWCPVHVRFVILNAAMEILLEINPSDENLAKSTTMVYVIDWLLKSPVNMIGLSVMDVLLGFLQYVGSVLRPGAEKAQSSTSAEKRAALSSEVFLSNERKELLDLLAQAVGHLATHIYYSEQITDMVQLIVSRLKTPATSDTPATTMTTTATDQTSLKPAAATSAEAHMMAFTTPGAKLVALKGLKNILNVASGKKSTAAGVECRKQVGIDVWEDTQWLLREQRDVYHAYVGVLLSWLKLETTEDDLKFKEPPGKAVTTAPKRDLSNISEKPIKRAASTAANHRFRAVHVAQSNFLRLLHLAIYERALGRSSDESEMVILHLLLTTLVDRLGVNAVRFGLPMIFKLQDDVTAANSSYTANAKVNVGSLVFGYFWELTEKFNLNVYRVGSAIHSEIEKRRKFGVWLDKIGIPPVEMDGIGTRDNDEVDQDGLENPELLRPLVDEVRELVDWIEESYNTFVNQPPPSHSRPNSPEHGLESNVPIITTTTATTPQKERLPPGVKDDMLSPWSKDKCLEIAEKAKARTVSLSGSKTGTASSSARNNQTVNGATFASTDSQGSSAQRASSTSISAGAAVIGHLDPKNQKRMTVPSASVTSVTSSINKGPPVRVNDLRRVLCANPDPNNRRLSPLRGRLDDTTSASNDETASSSSDSLVSTFSTSEIDTDGVSIRHQSTQDESAADGAETPRASTYVLAGIEGNAAPNGVPPVPSIPPTISIPSVPSLPGGFPNDSSRTSPVDRPLTAPPPRQIDSDTVNGNGVSETNHTSHNVLDKRKSRSSTMLATYANQDNAAERKPDHSKQNGGAGGHHHHHHRHETQDSLKEFLSSSGPDPEKLNGSVTAPRRASAGISNRRSAYGGIGRPPY